MTEDELNYIKNDVETTLEAFKIDGDKKADWAIKQIKEAEEERDRLVTLAQEQITDLQDRINEIKRKCDNDTGYLKGLLAQYFQTVPHKDTKTQEQYKLLSGTLVFKKPSQTINHDNEEDILKYLKENDGSDYIKTKQSVNWAEFKKCLAIVDGKVVDTELGTVVDVLKIEEVPASFSVKY